MKLKNNPSGVNRRRNSALILRRSDLKRVNSILKELRETPENKMDEMHTQRIVNNERRLVEIQNEIATLESRIVSDASAYQKRTKKYRGAR